MKQQARKISDVPEAAAAIALGNERFYDAAKNGGIDLEQQARMAVIGTLSAGIRHAIKNPLQVIRGIVEMLEFNKKSGIYRDFTKEQYEKLIADALTRVLDATNRAAGVVERVSGFAEKLKELRGEFFSLEQTVEEALRRTAFGSGQSPVAVEKVDASRSRQVFADRRAIEEIFFDLLTRAGRAAAEKGSVTVQVRRQGEAMEVSIRDPGPGISQEDREKIFAPFPPAGDAARDPGVPELFLAREILKHYGGGIAFESGAGQGTTVRVLLPVSPSSPRGPKES